MKILKSSKVAVFGKKTRELGKEMEMSDLTSSPVINLSYSLPSSGFF
jgi:hypothetical protein